MILLLVASGIFFVNGNFKTYVKSNISNDEFLTYIGVVGSIGNGGSRIFWNMLFNKTGYKTLMLSIFGLMILIFSTIRWSV